MPLIHHGERKNRRKTHSIFIERQTINLNSVCIFDGTVFNGESIWWCSRGAYIDERRLISLKGSVYLTYGLPIGVDISIWVIPFPRHQPSLEWNKMNF